MFCPVIWESWRSAKPVQQPGQVLVQPTWQHRGIGHLKWQCHHHGPLSLVPCWAIEELVCWIFRSLPPWLLRASQLPSAWNSYGSRKCSTVEELIKNGLVGFPDCLGRSDPGQEGQRHLPPMDVGCLESRVEISESEFSRRVLWSICDAWHVRGQDTRCAWSKDTCRSSHSQPVPFLHTASPTRNQNCTWCITRLWMPHSRLPP